MDNTLGLHEEYLPTIIDGIIRRSDTKAITIIEPKETIITALNNLPLEQRPGRDRSNQRSGSAIGEWTRYSTKMPEQTLQNMGFQDGQGLGKSLQGRIQPIEIKTKRYFDGAKSERSVATKHTQFQYGGSLAKHDIVSTSNEEQKKGHSEDKETEIPEYMTNRYERDDSQEENKLLTPEVSDEEKDDSGNLDYIVTLDDDWSPDDPHGVWNPEETGDSENDTNENEANGQFEDCEANFGKDNTRPNQRSAGISIYHIMHRTRKLGQRHKIPIADTELATFNVERRNLETEELIPRFNTNTGESSEVRIAPGDKPKKEDGIYVMQMVNIENNECMIFYDSGSNCNLIKGSLAEKLKLPVVSRNPIRLGAIGNKSVWSQYGSYELMLGPLKDGTSGEYIQVQGMPEVTGRMSKFDFRGVREEISQDPEISSHIIAERLPDYVGGMDASILIGVHNLGIMPILKYILPNGLGIFEAQLQDRFGSFLCFGGPHHTFTEINKMYTQTQSYQQTLNFVLEVAQAYLGSPYIIMTQQRHFEDDRVMSGIHFTRELPHAQERCSNIDAECICGCYEENLRAQGQEIYHTGVYKSKFSLSKVKRYEDEEDIGQDAVIRCESCSTCPKCSQSAKTRMVSLQERYEQEYIEKSLVVDLENKRILAALPFMTEPDEYLSKKHQGLNSNFGQAYRLFKSNCRTKDQTTKDSLIKTFQGLIDQGFMKKVIDMTPSQQKIIREARFRHYMPWTVAHKPESKSTQFRFAVDATMTGLNLILAKGQNTMTKIPEILISNRCLKYVWTSDISKLYNQLHLVDSSLPYGLFLFSDSLDPDVPPEEYAMLRAWYGVASSGNQSKAGIVMLADLLKDKYPMVKMIILKFVYVDDAFPGSNSSDIREEQIRQTKGCLGEGGFNMKYIIKSGETPEKGLVDDQGRLKVLGYNWDPEQDVMSLGLGEINFNKKRKGIKKANPFPVKNQQDVQRLTDTVHMTKRIIAAKIAELYDPCGFFEPFKVQLKLDFKEVVHFAWDSKLPRELDNHWKGRIVQLTEFEEVYIERCVIPDDAKDPSKVRLIGICDAGQEAAGCAVYAGYERQNGMYSSALLMSRSKLVSQTVPRNELEAVRMLAVTMENMEKILGNLLQEKWYYTDSTIAICWTANTNKRLKLYVLSRAADIRRRILGDEYKMGQEPLPLFHIDGDSNPADLLTKHHNITPSTLKPNHRWFTGDPWMTGHSGDLPQRSYFDLTISAEEQSTVDKECFKEPHIAINHAYLAQRAKDIDQGAHVIGIESIQIHCSGCHPEESSELDRICYGIHDMTTGDHCDNCDCAEADHLGLHSLFAEGNGSYGAKQMSESEYETINFGELVLKQGWKKGMAIVTRVMRWIHMHRHKRHLEGKEIEAECQICPFIENNPNEDDWYRLFEDLALERLLQEETQRLKNVLNKSKLREFKEDGGVLWFQSRLSSQLAQADLNMDLEFFDGHKIHGKLPVIGADSPIFLSYVHHIHELVRRHAGVEATLREVVKTFWPINNPRKIIHRVRKDCPRCRMIARKSFELQFQDHAQERTVLAPPFYACQADVVFGFQASIYPRARKTKKCYALILCCILTGATNILVMEGLSTRDVIQAIERHGARYGVPAKIYVDNGTNLIKLADVTFNMRNLQSQMRDLACIDVSISMPKAHEAQGRVERRVRALRESLERLRDSAPIPKSYLAWETSLAVISSQLNDLPMAKSTSTNVDDPFWNIITPNRLILGRNNERSLQGRMKIDHGPDLDWLVEKNQRIMSTWYKIFEEHIHHLMPRPAKWQETTPVRVGDIVLFIMSDAKYVKDERWKLGRVHQIFRPSRIQIEYNLIVSGESVTKKYIWRNPRQIALVTTTDEISTNTKEYLGRLQRGEDDEWFRAPPQQSGDEMVQGLIQPQEISPIDVGSSQTVPQVKI